MAIMPATPVRPGVASDRARDVEALAVALGTLLILFMLALAATSWPGAI